MAPRATRSTTLRRGCPRQRAEPTDWANPPETRGWKYALVEGARSRRFDSPERRRDERAESVRRHDEGLQGARHLFSLSDSESGLMTIIRSKGRRMRSRRRQMLRRAGSTSGFETMRLS